MKNGESLALELRRASIAEVIASEDAEAKLNQVVFGSFTCASTDRGPLPREWPDSAPLATPRAGLRAKQKQI